MDYAPDMIDESYIENVTDDLKDKLLALLSNKTDETYANAVSISNHIGLMIDDMIDGEDF